MTRFVTIGKSKQFHDFLKNEIRNGEYKPRDKFPSIRELSDKYGISKITVNSVISSLVAEGLLYVEQGKGTFVSEKKQRNMKNIKMIGVMMFDFRLESDVEISIFNGIQENLADNYFVIPYNSYNNLELFYKGLKGFMELGVDGMILVPPMDEKYDVDLIKKLIGKEIPIVLINRKIPTLKADFFSMDFACGTYKAVRHILGRGGRRILLVKHGSPSLGLGMYEGYARALKEEKLPVEPDRIISWMKPGDNDDTVTESAEALARRHIRDADGIVASDFFIYKARKVIAESGKKLPEELSLVGINDTVYSKFMSPPITAIPFPSGEIGKAAILAIMERIENRREEVKEKLFEPDIVIRDT